MLFTSILQVTTGTIFWRIGSLLLLAPPEDWARNFVASCGGVGQSGLANHSQFPWHASERFLSRSCVLVAPQKVRSYYLKKEFRLEARQFLEGVTNSVSSTIAARSNIGQGMSCSCPAFVHGEDDHEPLNLLDLVPDELLEMGGSEAAIWSLSSWVPVFVQEQRQSERFSTRNRSDVGNVLSFFFFVGWFLCSPALV